MEDFTIFKWTAAAGPPKAFKRFSGHLNFPPPVWPPLPSPPLSSLPHQLAFSTASQQPTYWTTITWDVAVTNVIKFVSFLEY